MFSGASLATSSAFTLFDNPDDPGHAFASTFVNGLVSDVQQGLTAHETQTVSPSWASGPNETAAEMARLGRQGTGPGSEAGYRNGSDIASDNAYQARRDQEWAAQNNAILARRGTEGGAIAQPDTGTPVSSLSATTGADSSISPATLTVIITGNRPAGTAVEVTLPAGVDAGADITREGTRTELLSGSAATAALSRLGVTPAGAAGRVMLYAGERAVGLLVPGVSLLLGETMAYVIHSGSQHAPGDAFVGTDGGLQRYTPAANGGLDLQSWSPQAPGSPEKVAGTWTTVGRFVPLSDEERAAMLRPTTTPAQPRGPQSPPPLPASHEPSQPLPGYAPDVGLPTVIGTPAAPQPTWEDLIIEASNSEKLGQHLRDSGRTPPLDVRGNELPGYIPHHMLPSEKWPQLDGLRDRFAAWDIDVNSADNGVWLPWYRSEADATGSYPERLHNREYRNAFEESFEGINSREEALAVLADIRSQLERGEFAGTRSRRP